jgi:hypothetical protein
VPIASATPPSYQWGKQDVMFAGGGEGSTGLCRCFSTRWARYRRTFQRYAQARQPRLRQNRDGFVIAGKVALWCRRWATRSRREDLRRADRLRRDIGRYDMVAPSGEGAVRCMRQALANVKAPVDYVNAPAHPPVAISQITAMREVFGRICRGSIRRSRLPASLGCRRARGDLFASADAERLHRRGANIDGSIPRLPTRRSCASRSTTQSLHHHVEQFRLRWNKRILVFERFDA